MLESCPFPERGRIHRQHAIRGEHPAEPSLQLLRLIDILLSGDLDTRLDLSDRHRGQKKLISGYVRNPIEDALMRIAPAQFRNNVCVEKIHGFIRKPVTLDDDAFYAAALAHQCVLPVRAAAP